jgi:sterol desaturase/sphingolipid hydroxylase (fatty acid hydroxylase superfamily)
MSGAKLVVLVMMIVNGLGLYLVERWFPRVSVTAGLRHIRPNLVLSGLLVALNFLVDRASAATGVTARGDDAAGLLHYASLPGWTNVIVVVVVLDGLTYLAHVLMHKLSPAWRFHRVHHSDAHVDVTTAFRQHPLESVWRYSFLGAGALALGASSGSVAVYLALSALNAQLEHADVSLPWRLDSAMRLLLSTPAMHRVHHSRAQPDTDTNYSNIFSFWDRLFGTYRAPSADERIACGLADHDAPDQQSTVGLLALPFVSSGITPRGTFLAGSDRIEPGRQGGSR